MRVEGCGLRISGLGIRVQGEGFRVQGSGTLTRRLRQEGVSGRTAQPGRLAGRGTGHACTRVPRSSETSTPLGSPKVPRHRATVGSYGGGVSHERGTPVQRYALTPSTVELIPTLRALLSRGGPIQDPILTRSVAAAPVIPAQKAALSLMTLLLLLRYPRYSSGWELSSGGSRRSAILSS